MNNLSKGHLTHKVSGLHVVVLAVHLLGGDAKYVDTEDVAAKAHELVPGMFAWRKYPAQINLELIRVALSDAKKPQAGGLLDGSGRQGWRLTEAGLSWISSEGAALLDEGLRWDDRARRAGSVDVVRQEREKMRLRLSAAWQDWSASRPISISNARALLRIDTYSSKRMATTKILRARKLFGDDPKVSAFLDEVSTKVLGSVDHDEQ